MEGVLREMYDKHISFCSVVYNCSLTFILYTVYGMMIT